MTIDLLIHCGADVDAMDFDGNTPLHILLRNFSPSYVFKIIDILCNAGAHLDYVNKKGHTPLKLVSRFHKKSNGRIEEENGCYSIEMFLCSIDTTTAIFISKYSFYFFGQFYTKTLKTIDLIHF
jgi:hypothetical protein